MNTVFDVLINQLNDRIEKVNSYISSGQCETYDEYRYMCGQIRGLAVAQNSLKDLLRKQMEEDDE